MKAFVQRQLANLARKIIAKHQPKIIGITGSVGKTSTRDAIYAVVSTAFSVRTGKQNFNNEFGLPFAILGVSGPERHPLKWLMVFLSGYFTLWFGTYPEILILEMGVDKPGDMDYLLSIAKPDIAVITNIGISHYEFFKSGEAVANEKGKLVEALTDDGVAILNADNMLAKQQAQKTNGKVITYGFSDDSDVRVRIVSEKFVPPVNTSFEVITHYTNFDAQVGAIGSPHLSAISAAIAVGLNLNIAESDIVDGISDYRPVAGRLNFLSGIKRTVILEDSYNASPDSVKEALAVLGRAPQQKKVVILGDMLELGELAEPSHQEIGKLVAGLNPDKFVAVGRLGKIMFTSSIEHGYSEEKAFWFPDSDSAKHAVREQLDPESIILIKGSQGSRMEKISKEILAEPAAAYKVLPRQYGKWIS